MKTQYCNSTRNLGAVMVLCCLVLGLSWASMGAQGCPGPSPSPASSEAAAPEAAPGPAPIPVLDASVLETGPAPSPEAAPPAIKDAAPEAPAPVGDVYDQACAVKAKFGCKDFSGGQCAAVLRMTALSGHTLFTPGSAACVALATSVAALTKCPGVACSK